jgi:hypothetical protein
MLNAASNFWDFAPSPRRPIDPVSRQIARTNQVAHPISLQIAPPTVTPTTPNPFDLSSFFVTNPLECADGTTVLRRSNTRFKMFPLFFKMFPLFLFFTIPHLFWSAVP